MAIAVGAVHVDVVPSTREFVKRMRADLLSDIDKLGEEVGRNVGEEVAEKIGRSVAEGIENGAAKANTARAGKAKATQFGGAFAKEFKARIQSALDDLPTIDLEVDDSALTAAQLQLRKLRKDLSDLRRKTVGVDIDADSAFAALRSISDRLQLLRSGKVDVQFDIDRATASLVQLQRQLARDVGGNFENTFRDSLAGALRNLPKIDLDATTDRAQLALAAIRRDVEAMSQAADVTIDIDSGAALADIERLSARLQSIADNESLEFKVRADAQAAIRQLAAVAALKQGLEKPVEIPVEPEIGDFARLLRAQLEAAIRTLPDVPVDADTSEAQRKLAEVRADLLTFRELAELDVDLNGDDALAEAVRLQAQLEALLGDETISYDVRVNADAALARLRQITAKRTVEVEVEPELGAFSRTLREQIDAITRNIPDIEVDADARPALAKLQEVRARFDALSDERIGVDMDVTDAIREVTILQGVLESLVNSADVEASFNARKALADAIAFRETLEAAYADNVEAEVEVKTPDLGATAAKLKADIERMARTLPDIQIDADSSEADRDIARLRAELASIAANIDIDTNIESVLLQLKLVRDQVNALDRDDINIDIDADIGSLLAQMAAARAAVLGAGDAADVASGRFARWRLILVAVLALFPLIAGAVVALSAALSVIITPIAAIAAGMDGIKAAGAELTDELDALRAAVSATFERGLAPAVRDVATLMPTLQEGLVGNAEALSAMAEGVTNVVTSGRNLDTIASSFDLINQRIAEGVPATQLLTQNMIDLTNIGAQGLNAFGEEMRQVGVAFAEVIARLNESGTAQAAVRALFQVLAELLNLLAPLTELGSVLLASFGPALAAALSVVGAAFSALAQFLDALPGPMQTVASIAVVLSGVFLALGARFAQSATNVALMAALMPGLATATGTAAVAARGLLAVLGGPLGVAIIGVVTALSFIGQAQSSAAEEAAAHTAAIQSLSDALEANNGIVTSSIRNQTEKALIEAGATDLANQLGLSTRGVTDALLEQGPAYDNLIASLEESVRAGEAKEFQDIRSRGPVEQLRDAIGGTTDATVLQGQAAAQLLEIIRPMGDSFRITAENVRLYQEATGQAATSAVLGADNALQLSEAMGTLGDESRSTSDAVEALKSALDALNGGTLTAEEAAGQLEAAIDEIGTAFTEAATASGETGAALINAAGQIDQTTEAGRNLFDATQGIRDSMLESATAAFDAAGGMTNVGAASAAASGQVQLARDAFIAAAQEAGLSAEAAARLADQYGLIPAEVTTLLTAQGIPVVEQELAGVQARFDAIPGTKTVVVESLSADARADLEDMGFRVRELPNGNIVIEATADAALGTLDSTVAQMRSTTGTMVLDANGDPAVATVIGTARMADGTTGTLTIEGNPTPVNGKIAASVRLADGSVGTVLIDGDNAPANGDVRAVVQFADGSVGTVLIRANDQATPVLNSLNGRVTRSTHIVNIVQQGSGLREFATGGFALPMADGGQLTGSTGRRLTPMSGAFARVVPPNTWRVIGDNIRVPEAYIPLDGSARSFSYARAAVRSFGYDVAPMATGGIIDSALSLTDRLIERGALTTQQASAFRSRVTDFRDTRSVIVNGDNRGVEARLAEVVDVLRKQKAVPPITVQDRSGNPTQTARSVQLAIRLNS